MKSYDFLDRLARRVGVKRLSGLFLATSNLFFFHVAQHGATPASTTAEKATSAAQTTRPLNGQYSELTNCVVLRLLLLLLSNNLTAWSRCTKSRRDPNAPPDVSSPNLKDKLRGSSSRNLERPFSPASRIKDPNIDDNYVDQLR